MRIRRWLCSIAFCLLALVALQARPMDLFIDLQGDFLIELPVCGYMLTLTPRGDIVRMVPVREHRRSEADLPQTLTPRRFERGRYTRLNGCEIEYDFFTDKISRFGDLEIKYALGSKKIEQIGSDKIEYDFASGCIRRIGSVPIEYDFFSKKISRIGSLRIDYHSLSKQIERISTPDYEIEFLDKWGKPLDVDARNRVGDRRSDRHGHLPGDWIPDNVIEYVDGDICFFLWISTKGCGGEDF